MERQDPDARDLSAELQRLQDLRVAGALSDDEFNALKAGLLGAGEPEAAAEAPSGRRRPPTRPRAASAEEARATSAGPVQPRQHLHPTSVEVDTSRGWTTRRVVIVGVGFILAIALMSVGLADPYCELRGTDDYAVFLTKGRCVANGGTVYGWKGAFPLIMYVAAAAVLVGAILLAVLDPWKPRRHAPWERSNWQDHS